jgi:DNA-binding SARP family transcriptional activator
LLALLLLAGGVPRSRDRLIDELWVEQPPASAVSALHVHLSKLRVVLGDLLVSNAAGYALAPDRFELDARLLDVLLERARGDRSRARSLLGEALALFRGDPLCDVACEGNVGHWRRALEDERLEAIMLRLDADLALGADAELVVELERLSAENPYEERLWGQLMPALYRSGRQADALEAFQRVRRHLAQELGLELGEPLQRLQRQMLERDPMLLGQPDAERPIVARPASNLPRPPGSLLGGEQELVELAAMATDPGARIITLAGVGGVGKTRLLVELARRQEPEYRNGAVFVRLEQLRDPTLVAAEIATAVSQHDGSEELDADALGRHVRARELLLVLDNFESTCWPRRCSSRTLSRKRHSSACSSPAARRCKCEASRSSR